MSEDAKERQNSRLSGVLSLSSIILLLELIFELLIEGSTEIAKDKKVNKWIRYAIAVLLSLFILVVIFAILVVGIIFLTEKKSDTKLFGILFIIIDIVLIISAIKKVFEIKQNTDKEES